MKDKIGKIIQFLINHWYVGIIESALVSALWQIYPSLENSLAKKTLVLSIILGFYLPGYLGLYGLYKKIEGEF
jgi:hypothetical protein